MSVALPVDSPAEGLYGPDSLTRRIYQESAVVLLGWPRAILLQLAHPLVAAGVAQHSGFRQDPLRRFWHTLDVTVAIVFGSAEQAREAVAGINAIHAGVTGRLQEKVGRFAGGTPYQALDPQLLLWVFATVRQTDLLVYSRYVAPLSAAERERYHQEGRPLASMLGIPDDLVPATHAGLCEYVEAMLASDTIAVGPAQRELAGALLYPSLPGVPRWLLEPVRAITVGSLPEKLRDGYGLALTLPRRALYQRSPTLVRALRRCLPRQLRHLPRCRAEARLGANPQPLSGSRRRPCRPDAAAPPVRPPLPGPPAGRARAGSVDRRRPGL
ncbi:MAG TPA: oxygenase MpaB family protein [Egibacteraceae bacterium]|nr:oxygenase MpaB family protein [Egibacteraceae bacterium]